MHQLIDKRGEVTAQRQIFINVREIFQNMKYEENQHNVKRLVNVLTMVKQAELYNEYAAEDKLLNFEEFSELYKVEFN